MIDPKKGLRKILRQWGHDVYIQRILKNGNYLNTFEKVTTRQVGPGGTTNSIALQEHDEGLYTKYDVVYYFEENVHPKEGDRVYENFSMKAQSNYTMYRINAVTPVRGRLGKIVFWVAGCMRER